MRKVFVSYARESRALVEVLVDDLGALGNDVWFDRAVTGGQRWWEEILANIRDSHFFVSAVTQDSLESIACRRELTYATQLLRPVVPIVLDQAVNLELLPASLAEIHFVDYRVQDKNSLKALARTLNAYPTSIALPSPLPEPPPPPISYLAALREKIESDGHLSLEAQSAIVVELRQAMRDPTKAADAYGLLQRLRKRRDLFASIAEDIAELLIPRPSPTAQSTSTQPQEGVSPPPFAFGKKIAALRQPATPSPEKKPQTAPTDSLKGDAGKADTGGISLLHSDLMGTCPNCKTELPMNASECSHCRALFGLHSDWKVLAR